ncbi:MAG: D-glycero-beta-D-manno-heptose-7-phosphate kinase [Gammaproteobacteria bacterium]|nr:D-glycero-beta-D-manno-heptose-7-phosphate kinase [Gammaproteobacteria bacterium]|tara:strand:+ start:996 stop:1907 length:912 start_codon:yes stop_codon:yes gene_type:complete
MKFNFSDITILVAGDFMIDHYIMGTSNRISPEAPVPVVIPNKEYSIPGGAANVAMNLRALGANVFCLGVVGDDIWGETLLSLLNNNGINISEIDIIKNHPTTLKQRIYSNGKQVARIDKERIIDWNPNFLSKNIENYDACILSDYNKGVIKNADIDTNILIVDPKKDDFSLYNNANIITPNINELQKATNIKIEDNESIIDACIELIRKNNFDYIVAKKGEEGMTIVGKNSFVKNIKAHKVENPDVTGAGDTVISALSIAYAKTQDIELSARFANKAAATAVSKTGTATVTIDEINNYIGLDI